MTALPRRVIVDDNDPQIQYSDDKWALAHFNGIIHSSDSSTVVLFQNTSHVAQTEEAASPIFRFQGSSPQLFGDSDGASYECFIDGVSIGSTLQPLVIASTVNNNGLLCDGTPFVEGREYTLTLNISDMSENLFFDYATYIPPASAPLGSATVLVDRLDPAIVYHDAWTLGILGNPAIYTQTNGANLTFNFNGTSVSWVGFTPASGQKTSNVIYAMITIDGAKPISIGHDAFGNVTNDILFISPTLNPGPHSLKVTYQGSNTTPPLALNHFIVANNVSTLAPPIAPTSSQPHSQPPSVSSTVAIVDEESAAARD